MKGGGEHKGPEKGLDHATLIARGNCVSLQGQQHHD